ncbi:alpha/beta hydrolase family protein [Kordiimonas pumila]|uniref:Alpha/beta hydrolase family protein n=1 Tax=Kordiimonas pumila TaxID=2161677 RepID=A0ABV7D375_9PROT|nr:hypothetical protein [Kordiimonas pumila]
MLIILQSLLLLLLIATAVLSFLPKEKFGSLALKVAIGAICIAVLDLIMGHGRWQMVPAYALSLVLFAIIYSRTKQDAKKSLGRKIAFGGYVVVGTVLLCVAAVLPYAFPMYEVPAPTGTYKVGFSSIYMKDENRPETYTDDPDDKRELMVRVWYPSDVPAGTKPLPFLTETEPLLATLGPVPDFLFDHVKQMPGHSYAGTPLLAGENKFPVLVFSHGFGVFAQGNALALENLASHGYVVFSIEHPYNAAWVKFPDGHVATFDGGGVSPEGEEEMAEAMRLYTKLATGLYEDDYNTYLAAAKAFAQPQTASNEGVTLWVDDTAFVLDELALAGSSDNPGIDQFAGRLDMDKVGIFGMSYGGATAGMFCAHDDRCTAGLNMDGFQFGENSFDVALEKPFMIMNSESRLGFKQYLNADYDWDKPLHFHMNDFFYYQSKNIAYSMVVSGATHMSYTDMGFTSKIGEWMGALGPIDIYAMNDIMNDYTLAFFDKHLRGINSPLLEGDTSAYPNVSSFISRDGRSVSAEEAH